MIEGQELYCRFTERDKRRDIPNLKYSLLPFHTLHGNM